MKIVIGFFISLTTAIVLAISYITGLLNGYALYRWAETKNKETKVSYRPRYNYTSLVNRKEIDWDLVNDILDSVKLADKTGNKEVFGSVSDYVVNTYGDKWRNRG